MPYIEPGNNRRELLEPYEGARTKGELNYAITRLCDLYMSERGGVSYDNINDVVGVLECAKLELYRRMAAPYEDAKRDKNGDVYDA